VNFLKKISHVEVERWLIKLEIEIEVVVVVVEALVGSSGGGGGGGRGGRRKEEGGRRKEEGGRRKEEGGRRKEEGGRRKEEEGGGRGHIHAPVRHGVQIIFHAKLVDEPLIPVTSDSRSGPVGGRDSPCKFVVAYVT
jgi:hypothetical protein